MANLVSYGAADRFPPVIALMRQRFVSPAENARALFFDLAQLTVTDDIRLGSDLGDQNRARRNTSNHRSRFDRDRVAKSRRVSEARFFGYQATDCSI
ncbi:hypothetical protein [Rhizobium redzepovicii]|uniref:hypothetical protein n=1 Tax=Rhizobium redzepovicii TaxID=2867518 RepID=UPI002871E61F|nr:hypothetical protein [Rhizobium redzepovicii]MDR9781388.1 hypothetical protein [Rhizobium redzepovicii]